MSRHPRRAQSKRNPIARAVASNPLFRTRAEPTRQGREQKADAWDRNAKHQGKETDNA